MHRKHFFSQATYCAHASAKIKLSLQQVTLVIAVFQFLGDRDVIGDLFRRSNALFYDPSKPSGLQPYCDALANTFDRKLANDKCAKVDDKVVWMSHGPMHRSEAKYLKRKGLITFHLEFKPLNFTGPGIFPNHFETS